MVEMEKSSVELSSRLCSTSIFSKFGSEKEKEGELRGEQKKQQRGSDGARGRAGSHCFTFIHFRKMCENTIVLRLQQPGAYKPMSERKAVKLHFTQSALTHYPIDQLYNALFYKRFSCEGNWSFQCASHCIKRGDKLGSSHCPYVPSFSAGWWG